MSDVAKVVPEVSEEHRRRRRDAYQRAASAHTRAAIVHEASAFFEQHGKTQRAAYHRSADEVQHARARDDRDTADAQ